MGNSQNYKLPQHSLEQPLKSSLIISNEEELKYIIKIIQQRSNFANSHILTVKGYSIKMPTNRGICQDQRQLVLVYEDYDERLDMCLLRNNHQNYNKFGQEAVYYFIFCLVDGLLYLHHHSLPHGDVSTRKICRSGHKWKLIDRHFLEAGITAYERVLEGKQGFVSPEQMQKIRQGCVRESPIINEADDVFALGMTTLQLMTGKPSVQCYRESFIRFDNQVIKKRLDSLSFNYSVELCNMVKGMISFFPEKRLKLKDILQNKVLINKYHNGKISMKHNGDDQRSTVRCPTQIFGVSKNIRI